MDPFYKNEKHSVNMFNDNKRIKNVDLPATPVRKRVIVLNDTDTSIPILIRILYNQMSKRKINFFVGLFRSTYDFIC